MYTESTLVIRARIALANNENIKIGQSEDFESVKFFFLDGMEMNGFENWFDECKNRNIKDFKYYLNIGSIERHPLGETMNEEAKVVCIWSDKVTCFELREVRSGEKVCLEFYEKEFSGNVDESYNKADIVADFKKNLAELKELAGKIGDYGSYFAGRFGIAYEILDGKTSPNYGTMPEYLQDLRDELKDIMFAQSFSYVFGGMGSWNDDPQGIAAELGLGDDYERLTNDLIINRRKALVYVSNNC